MRIYLFADAFGDGGPSDVLKCLENKSDNLLGDWKSGGEQWRAQQRATIRSSGERSVEEARFLGVEVDAEGESMGQEVADSTSIGLH